MDKAYQPQKYETKIYQSWEKKNYFQPKIDPKKKPFTVILPLPNANDPLHMGHALFVIEDIMVRYHRLLGEPTLWLPGGDHAGIETQYVFEKELAKGGKSRFDFDRQTLYQMMVDFTEKNKNLNKEQMKKLGFSLDWSRYHYSLEPEIVNKVLKTFRKLHQDNLIYRGERIVNYCTRCGTAFSDLEVEYKEKEEFLYYLDYGSIKIATTRPETIFADAAVAVNPQDKRYRQVTGQKATIPLINKKIPVITDELVDVGFGTGALKVTPGHDATDFEIGQKHQLKTMMVIDKNGRMINLPKKYLELSVGQARRAVINDLQKAKKLIKVEPLKHSVGHCYRCGAIIEPMVIPQWFVKITPLVQPALEAVKKKKTKIIPKKRFEKMYLDWLTNIHDWNISRQIVWGPRIPVWYCLDCNPDLIINFLDKNGQKITGTFSQLKDKHSLSEIKTGLQTLLADKAPIYSLEEKPCSKCGRQNILQETDTFDTWFLSSQWPLTALGYPDSADFKYFYPTSVLDTLWDILFFWAARMMMLGIYLVRKPPFKVIHLHCRVVDEKGQKMSKSKGNVVDPIIMVEKYGADALRMALVFGSAPGSDIRISDDKVRAMRNFVNKVWNASRFVLTHAAKGKIENQNSKLNKDDKEMIKELNRLIVSVTKHLDNFRFDLAAEEIYQCFWHRFCDHYLETTKARQKAPAAQWTLQVSLRTFLKLLHPFMPFITETIWQKIKTRQEPDLVVASWPEKIKIS